MNRGSSSKQVKRGWKMISIRQNIKNDGMGVRKYRARLGCERWEVAEIREEQMAKTGVGTP